jgi:hypothetical protein
MREAVIQIEAAESPRSVLGRMRALQPAKLNLATHEKSAPDCDGPSGVPVTDPGGGKRAVVVRKLRVLPGDQGDRIELTDFAIDEGSPGDRCKSRDFKPESNCARDARSSS